MVNVSYAYSLQSLALKNITVSVKRGERIGIVGSTGSGKSTLVDLLMGLLKPSSGAIF